MLAVWLVGVVADGFEAEHCDDLLVFFPAAFGVNGASHLVGHKEGRLFVGEEDEAKCSGGFFVGESAGEGKGGCNG